MPTGDKIVLAAGQTAAQQMIVMTADIIMEKVKKAKISEAATTAIGTIGECASDFKTDFFESLRRNDFLHLFRQYFSGQVFEPKKVSKRVRDLQIAATHKSFQILEINRRNAVKGLMTFQGYLGSHIVTRCNEFFGDQSHSHVLLALHYVINDIILTLSDANALPTNTLTQYQDILEIIADAFSKYVKDTATEASSGNRRKEVARQLIKTKDEAKKHLDLTKANVSLQDIMRRLCVDLQEFTSELQKGLLLMVVVDGSEADVQLKETEITDHHFILSYLDRILLEPQQILLKKEISTGFRRTFFEGKTEGIISENPFFQRTKPLLDEYERAILKNKQPTKEQLFFRVLHTFRTQESKQESSDVDFQEIIKTFKQSYNTAKGNFLMLEKLLPKGSDHADFLQATLALCNQSSELITFISALSSFMEIVGKIGFFCNPDLHEIFTALIEQLLIAFDRDLQIIKGNIIESASGKWLDPLFECFDGITTMGMSLLSSMKSFSKKFWEISNREAMETEFTQKKRDLLVATLRIAKAIGFSTEKTAQLNKLIEDSTFSDFTNVARASTRGDLYQDPAVAYSFAQRANSSLTYKAIQTRLQDDSTLDFKTADDFKLIPDNVRRFFYPDKTDAAMSFSLSCEEWVDNYKLYVPQVESGWVGSTFKADETDASKFMLTKLESSVEESKREPGQQKICFRMASKQWSNYPLYVCGDSWGGLVNRYKVDDDSIIGKQNQLGTEHEIILKVRLLKSKCMFILSTNKWPEWTLYVGKVTGKVFSKKGADPGKEGYFHLTPIEDKETDTSLKVLPLPVASATVSTNSMFSQRTVAQSANSAPSVLANRSSAS